MKEFVKPLIDIIEIKNDEIICTSGGVVGEEQYGPNDIPEIIL